MVTLAASDFMRTQKLWLYDIAIHLSTPMTRQHMHPSILVIMVTMHVFMELLAR